MRSAALLLVPLAAGFALALTADEDGPTAGTPGQASQRSALEFVKTAQAAALAPPAPIVPRKVHSPKRLPPAGPQGAQPKDGGPAAQKGELNFKQAAEAAALAPPTPVVPRAVHSPKRLPADPPPGGAPAQQPAAPAQPSPPPAATFIGLRDIEVNIPADTAGAAGPDHLVVATNSEIGIQERDGDMVSKLRLDTFWKSLNTPTAPSTFDPKVLYDRFEKRWIVVACGDAESATSSLLVAVSKTQDPTAGWHLYRIDADPNNQRWFDYPSLGLNKKWIVVQGNMFGISDGSFRSHVYVFNKADLYAGGAGKFRLITRADLGLTQAPEVNGDNSDAMTLVESVAANANNRLRLYRLTGDVDDPQLSTVGDVTVPGGWDFAPPGGLDFAPQKGTANKIQANDSRMQVVVSRGGLLWCVQTVFLPAGGPPTRCAVQWWQLDPVAAQAGQRVKQFGRIDGPTDQFFRAYPSVAVNKDEDVLVGYSVFHKTQFAGSAYSLRRKADPPNTFRKEVVFRAGKARYFKTFGGGENRWGDYSSTVVDPNDTDFWTIQKFANTPADHYATQWALVKPPAQ